MNIKLKERVLLLEKDNREKIKKTFKVNQDIADFAHEINENLSIWIIDSLVKQLIKERHFTRDQVVTFLNTASDDKDNYLQVFKSKTVYILDYYNNPAGKEEYPDFDKFKKEDFDVLYTKSDNWHKSLRSKNVKTINIEDTEPGVEILKKYETNEKGEMFYWADLHKKSSKIESSRMGHCGTTSKGDTLISLRSFTPMSDGTYVNKSHVTLALNRKNKYYTQCKGKQNRKPSVMYTNYLYDLFTFDKDIQSFSPEYSGTDFKVSDLSIAQILKLKEIKPKLIDYSVSNYVKFAEELNNYTPIEIYENYIKDKIYDPDFKIDNNSSKFNNLTREENINKIISAVMPHLIKDNSIMEKLKKEFFNFENLIFFTSSTRKDKDIVKLFCLNSIMEYIAFTNNFSKIKSVFDNYVSSENKNVINIICYLAQKYPDYVISYAYKLIEPIVAEISKSSESSILSIEDDYNCEDTYEIAKKFIEKNKDVYINLAYIVNIDDIKKYLDDEADYEDFLSGDLDTSQYTEFLKTFEGLIKKINNANNLFKGSDVYSKFRKDLVLGIFSNNSFKDIIISMLYLTDKNLIEYSLLDDYDLSYLDKEIELNINPFSYASFKIGRYDSLDSFQKILENLDIDYFPDVGDNDIEDFLDYAEKTEKDKKIVQDDMVKETGVSSYEELLKRIEEDEDNSDPSLYDMFTYLNDKGEIDDLNDAIKRSLELSYETSLQDEYYNICKSAFENFADNTPFSLKGNYPSDDYVIFEITPREIVSSYLSDKENINLDNLNGNFDIEPLAEAMISSSEETIWVDFDRVYGSFNSEYAWDHYISNY